MSDFIDIAPEVAEALAVGKPVVALESTIISHGMPYPQNLKPRKRLSRMCVIMARSRPPSR